VVILLFGATGQANGTDGNQDKDKKENIFHCVFFEYDFTVTCKIEHL
jgi:hypothetical protein